MRANKSLGRMRVIVLVAFASLIAVLAGCETQPEAPPPAPAFQWPEIKGYQAMKIPADNPMTKAKVELGKQLFYDARLSGEAPGPAIPAT